jgi:hypothetical protein
MRKLLLVLAVLAFVAVWGVALAAWPSLPERIPVHFDLHGRPDRAGDKAEWLVLPVVSTLLTGLFVVLSRGTQWLATRHPEWVNVPRKKQFLALSPEARARVLEPLATLGLVQSAVVNLLFVWILLGSYAVATGHSERVHPAGFFAIAPVLIGAVVWMTLELRRRIERESR